MLVVLRQAVDNRERKRMRLYVSIAIGLALALVVTAITGPFWGNSNGVVYFPTTIETELGPMPPCVPVRVISTQEDESAVGRIAPILGPWGEADLADGIAETALDRLQDCLSASSVYRKKLNKDLISEIADGALTRGMPVGLAIGALGPPHNKKNDERTTHYVWKQRDKRDIDKSELTNISVTRMPVSMFAEATDVEITVARKGKQIRFENPIGRIDLTYPSSLLRGSRDRVKEAAEERSAFDAGMQAYERGAYALALESWKKLAENGYARAQYSIGDLYYQGEGVAQNMEEAAHWFRQAAERLYPAAQYHLGFLYSRGEGVPRDMVQAYFWIERAAMLGNRDAETARDAIKSRLSEQQLASANQKLDDTSITNPRLILHVVPDYPELARVARVDGRVVLQAIVGEDGHVYDVEIVRLNRPNLGFDEMAEEALYNWRYEPATAFNEPVEVYFTVVVDFSLH